MVNESSVLFTNTAKSLIWLLRMNKLKTKYNALAQCNLKVYRFLLPYLPYTKRYLPYGTIYKHPLQSYINIIYTFLACNLNQNKKPTIHGFTYGPFGWRVDTGSV